MSVLHTAFSSLVSFKPKSFAVNSRMILLRTRSQQGARNPCGVNILTFLKSVPIKLDLQLNQGAVFFSCSLLATVDTAARDASSSGAVARPTFYGMLLSMGMLYLAL